MVTSTIRPARSNGLGAPPDPALVAQFKASVAAGKTLAPVVSNAQVQQAVDRAERKRLYIKVAIGAGVVVSIGLGWYFWKTLRG